VRGIGRCVSGMALLYEGTSVQGGDLAENRHGTTSVKYLTKKEKDAMLRHAVRASIVAAKANTLRYHSFQHLSMHQDYTSRGYMAGRLQRRSLVRVAIILFVWCRLEDCNSTKAS